MALLNAAGKAKTLQELTKIERDALLAKPSMDCTDEEKLLKLQLLEFTLAQVNKNNDLSGLKPTDKVTLNVPLMPDGNMININNVKYYGRVTVEKRCADEIMYYLSESFRGERELLQHRVNGVAVSRTSPEAAQIERYNEMMGGTN